MTDDVETTDKDFRQRLIDNYVELARAVHEDIGKMLAKYDSGNVDEAVMDAAEIVGGFLNLGHDPRFAIGMALIYPDHVMPKEGFDDSLPIN